MVTRITTRSGSTYDIRKDENGQWWVRGNNVASVTSVPLNNQWWEINEPFPMPILIGSRMIFTSKYVMEPKDHPKRIMGGGKITSPVVDIREYVELSGKPS